MILKFQVKYGKLVIHSCSNTVMMKYFMHYSLTINHQFNLNELFMTNRALLVTSSNHSLRDEMGITVCSK